MPALNILQGTFQRDTGVASQRESFALYPGAVIDGGQETSSCLCVTWACHCTASCLSFPTARCGEWVLLWGGGGPFPAGDMGGAVLSIWRGPPLTPPSLYPTCSLPVPSFSTTTARTPSTGGCEVRRCGAGEQHGWGTL